MRYELKESLLSKLSARLNLMVVLTLGLLASNVILSCIALHATRNQRREVVPFGMSNGYVISDTAVDTHYLNLMSENFIALRLNVTPMNVSSNNNKLLSYIEPSLYAEFKKVLLSEESLIQSKKITSFFEVLGVESNPLEFKTIISGNLNRYVGYRALKPEPKKYLIQYRYRSGALSIVGFKELQGESDEK